jgi:hypothetical protein
MPIRVRIFIDFWRQATELRNACWDHVHLDDMMPDLLGWPAAHTERENRAA